MPDKIGFGYGIGRCESYEAGMDKLPSASDIRRARMVRGNSSEYGLFYGGTAKRKCKLFKPVLSG
jgi:hypothetical protein